MCTHVKMIQQGTSKTRTYHTFPSLAATHENVTPARLLVLSLSNSSKFPLLAFSQCNDDVAGNRYVINIPNNFCKYQSQGKRDSPSFPLVSFSPSFEVFPSSKITADISEVFLILKIRVYSLSLSFPFSFSSNCLSLRHPFLSNFSNS